MRLLSEIIKVSIDVWKCGMERKHIRLLEVVKERENILVLRIWKE